MRKRICDILTKTYGILMTASFFAGFLSVIPFIIAIFLGGEAAETICLFLYKKYYVWVIATASLAIVIGLIAMYFGKKEGLSVKSVGKKDKK